MSIFQPASKTQAFARLAIFGPSGSGKTMSSLRIATGLGGKIAVIDTEHGSASKYADRWPFDVVNLTADQSIDRMIEMLKAARDAGYGVVIIDSLSHAWKELLMEVDKLASAKYRGNTWSAWAEGTPKQNKLISAILNYPGHVIATMRSKTEWVVEDKGKPVRVGLAPEQGKGIEYEFDVLLEMSHANVGTVTKDRTGKFHGRLIEQPDEAFGEELRDWLGQGDAPPVVQPMPADEPIQPWQVKALQGVIEELDFGIDAAGKARARAFIAFSADLPRVDNVLALTEPEANFALRQWGEGTGQQYRVDPGLLASSLHAFHEHEDLQRSVGAHGAPPPADPGPGDEADAGIPEFDPNTRPKLIREAAAAADGNA